MPEKLGNGGNGLEQYDQNTGKYTIDGQPNKYYNNPTEHLVKALSNAAITGEENPLVLSSNSFEFADVELCSLTANFLSNGNIKIQNVKHSETNFNNDTHIITISDDISNSQYYLENEGLFHEIGHAVDYSYDNYGGTYSRSFISSKYNMSLGQMIIDEVRSNVDYYELKKEFENFAMTQMVNSSINSEYLALQKEKQNIEQAIRQTPQYISLSEQVSKKEAELEYVRNNQLGEESNVLEEFKNVNSKLNDFYNTNLQKQLGEKLNRYNELSRQRLRLYQESKSKQYITYKDISDMVQGVLGDSKKIAGGHPDGYFEDYTNLAKEAFAEIMSAKAINHYSYDLLKKYIPKSLEIFDEIVANIKSKQGV